MRVRRLFADLSVGRWHSVVDGLAPRFSYRFVGDTAISGQRSSRSAMTAWWQRLFRLFPDARFQVRDILVAGWPWDTRIATHMTVRATLATGERYENEFMQMMRLRWGRITSIVTIEDTQRLADALDRLAAVGVAEAAAPPITDRRSN